MNTPAARISACSFRQTFRSGSSGSNGVPFRYFAKPLRICFGVVGEVHDHHILLALVAAIQAGDRLHGVTVHHRLVEEHSGEQWLVEAGLKFVRHDHDPIVVALETVFDLFACPATRSRRVR